MKYNIFFGVAAVAYLILLNIYIRTQYSTKSENNRRFQRLAAIMLATTFLDDITAITISYGSIVPPMMNLILNTLYFLSNIVLGLTFLNYCINLTRRGVANIVIEFLQKIIFITSAFLLAANLFNGVLFSFDSSGEYIHGKLYFLVFAEPFAFILLSSFVLMSGFRDFTKNQRLSVLLYMVTTLAGCIIQSLYPNILFILFSISLGLLMLMFSMETPDYQSVQEALAALEISGKNAEEAMLRAQEADKAKSEFLTGVSHELRTPINAIIGYNDLIMNESDDATLSEYASQAKKAGETLLSMISNIIEFGEIEHDNVVIEAKPYSTAALFSDITDYARYNADRKGLECKVSIDPSIPAVLVGDMVRIKQIFSSIISNAAKYTEKGFVEIIVRWYVKDSSQGVMFVDISDSGIGIKEEDIEKITAAFGRTDDIRNTTTRGIGIGLTIASKLLSRMGGALSIASEYGKGTTISFEIHQEISDGTPIGILEKKEAQTEISHMVFTAPAARILAVDDNKINLDVFCRCLKSTEVRIDTATDGVQALSLISKNVYDMIFLDHMMPVMDGVETIKTIKKQKLCEGIPIVVVTANAVSDKNFYYSVGFDEYLPKPVSRDQLLGIMIRFLDPKLIHEKAAQGHAHVPAAQPAAPIGRKLTFNERFSFLDTQMGMGFCCEDEEFYLSMIESYVEGSRYDDIENYFNSGDYENYRIQVHALKSASRTIGAAELGDKAERLEKSAKEGNIEYVIRNNEEFMKDYAAMLTLIRSALASDTQVPSAPANSPAADTERRKLLIIDDDEMSIAIADQCLTDRFDVEICRSGKNAMNAIGEVFPDIIAADITSRGMNGTEFISELKKDMVFGMIPLVIISPDASPETEMKCLELGAADFVKKPYSAKVLEMRLEKAFTSVWAGK